MTKLTIIYTILSTTFTALTATETENFIITTKYGKVEGVLVQPDRSELKCPSFFGIPYAQPPVGDLRFNKPQPLKPWSDTLKATSPRPICIHLQGPDCPYPDVSESEDCLFLNIVTPRTSIQKLEKNRFAVMVWIHGGGWLSGSAIEYDSEELCKNLASKDVIVVSIQYRLGIFGFLATGDEAAPGNYGLHDQVAALKWIYENIGSFGGDSKRITIFGESAGGATVSLLGYIKDAQPYFAQSIAQSGSAFAYFALNTKPIESFHLISAALGCGDSNTNNLEKVNCLRNKNVKEISAVHLKIFGSSYFKKENRPMKKYQGGGHEVVSLYLNWNPVVDGDLIPLGGLEQLVKETPNKPFITGVTQKEQVMFVKPTLQSELHLRPCFKTQVPYDIEHDEELVYSTMQENIQEALYVAKYPLKGYKFDPVKFCHDEQCGLMEKIVEFFYVTSQGDGNNKTFLANQIMQLRSDLQFNIPSILDAENRKQAGSLVWMYSFDHFLESDYPTDFKHAGAGHGADLLMLFNMSERFEPLDKKVSELMCKLWTDFAKYGRPTLTSDQVQWPEYGSLVNPVNLKIKVNPEISTDFHRKTVPFWTVLFPQLKENIDKNVDKSKAKDEV